MRHVSRTGSVQLLLAVVLALAMLCVFGHDVLADDVSPPTWARLGMTNLSTSQEWEFITNNPGPGLAPDGNTVPLNAGNGGPGPSATVSPNMGWGIGDGDGQWTTNAGTGAISMPIPNWIDLEPLKYLHFQATYSSPMGAAGAPTFTIANATNTDGPIISITQTGVTDFVSGLQRQHVEDWQILPNPDWENIILNVPLNTSVDELIIDTISIPEPASLALLALAGGLMVARRRRA